MRRTFALTFAAGCLLAMTASGIAAASVVKNGSLEDLQHKFKDTRCNYMAVNAGSHAISRWSVPRATTGELAWGTNTCDGYSAARGGFFVDLSGFGADSPNGAIQQSVSMQPDERYRFSIDVCTCNDGSLAVKVGRTTLTLSPGHPFVVGGISWTPMAGTFKAKRDKAKLKIANATPGAQIVLIDAVSIAHQ